MGHSDTVSTVRSLQKVLEVAKRGRKVSPQYLYAPTYYSTTMPGIRGRRALGIRRCGVINVGDAKDISRN